MRVAGINNVNFLKTKSKQPKQKTTSTPLQTLNNNIGIKTEHLTLLGLAVGATVLAIKKGDKIANTISNAFRKNKNTGYIIIPIERKNVELDTQKLRQLPANIRSRAIEALNSALTAEDKTQVIKNFGLVK